jgi:hypothetical protein
MAVSCSSLLILIVLISIAVSYSFSLSLAKDSVGLILPTSAVAVLLLPAADDFWCKVSLYSLPPGCSGPSRALIPLSFSPCFWIVAASLVIVFDRASMAATSCFCYESLAVFFSFLWLPRSLYINSLS